ncbi:hypothetical protein DPMN_061513 [Dreissena polymorpha]|uniref:Uncharacterized protein n=1 Tax=Dreissena polymorpha TaxID=45954 RepID=A0A9D4C761_DREPO|nr:hypothetical protein DPMN_061513 [Dreissena polymorpha]
MWTNMVSTSQTIQYVDQHGEYFTDHSIRGPTWWVLLQTIQYVDQHGEYFTDHQYVDQHGEYFSRPFNTWTNMVST